MKSVLAILVFSGVFLSVSGKYGYSWQHDEDTIPKSYGESMFEVRQIEMINLVAQRLKDSEAKKKEENDKNEEKHTHDEGGKYKQEEETAEENADKIDQDNGDSKDSKSVANDDEEDENVNRGQSGDRICGYHLCSGSNAYCCYLSNGETGCCWSTRVYDLWWFWVIWVILFFLILGCSLVCWRRRRAQYRYTVMANSEYPGYGTVVHTSTSTSTQSSGMPSQYGPPPGQQYGPPPGQQYVPSVGPQYVPPSAPAGPPGYAAPEKPPAYSR